MFKQRFKLSRNVYILMKNISDIVKQVLKLQLQVYYKFKNKM